jgi:DNA topoisomerase VI subunit B
MLQHEIMPPDAGGTIESLSALAYSLESAIGDIVDNSLDASASRVDVVCHSAGIDSFVAIADNGDGMTEKELVKAMAIAARGPRADRAQSELGRFGMAPDRRPGWPEHFGCSAS